MKIAIYEPLPRVCGPMSCAFHTATGFRKLGHEADVLTFTRSGKPSTTWGKMKPGIRWWSSPMDRVGSIKKAGEILDEYDLVILNDVRTVMLDRDALKGRAYLVPTVPDYVTVLANTSTPFTFALHGNNYPPSEVPYAENLVALPNFTGTAITYSPTSPALSQHLWPDVTWYESPLPYEPRLAVDAPTPLDDPDTDLHVGITGRYITVKGHHVLAVAAVNHMPSVRQVDIWGACSMSLAASASYKTYEALRYTMNLHGERRGLDPTRWDTKAGGDVIRHIPWWVEKPDGGKISYHGGYESSVDVCATLGVHVDLTTSDFSDGMEFSQFEAIDAGCLQVSVESMWSTDFAGEVVPSVGKWPGELKLIKSERGQELLASVGDAVERAVGKPRDEQLAAVRHNRAVLRTKHDPARIAGLYLKITSLT